MNKKRYVFIVMGISGTGKSTIAQELQRILDDGHYIDADDYHPKENINKMSSSIPLNDEDRFPWLEKLVELAEDSYQKYQYTFIACSSLKKVYRDILRKAKVNIRFVYLYGDKVVIKERMLQRAKKSNHFMSTSLLDSQLKTLEPPKGDEIIRIDITQSIKDIIREFKNNQPDLFDDIINSKK